MQSRIAEPLVQGASPAIFTGRSPKSFSLAKLEFRPFSTEIFTRRDILRLHLQYHVHVILIACEELETYKKVVLGQVSDWLDKVHSKRNQHALLVQITSTSSANDIVNARSKPISRADLVMERLVTDFGGNKNNRIVQLKLRDKQDESWTTTIDALADAVYTSFWNHLSELEDDTRQLVAKQNLPGWNFCTFLINKEAIALSLQSAGLFDEALQVYTELEELFLEVQGTPVKDVEGHSLQWLDKVAELRVDDVYNIVFKDKVGEIREAIMKCDVSKYDISIYLFGCKFRLWKESSNVASILNSACRFVSDVAYDSSVSSNTVDKISGWVFSLAIEIIAACDDISQSGPALSDLDKLDVLSARGRLCLSARRQLDKKLTDIYPGLDSNCSLGMQKGLLIQTSPVSLTENISLDKHLWTQVLNDRALFLSVYLYLTNHAGEGYRVKQYSHMLDTLLRDKASVFCMSGNYDKALAIFNEIISTKDTLNWTVMDIHILRSRAICFQNLGDYKLMLKDLLHAWKLAVAGKTNSISELLDQLIIASKTSPEPLEADLEPYFIFSDFVALRSNPDIPITDLISMTASWPFALSVNIDYISLLLAGDRKDFIFKAERVHIVPEAGERLSLKCDVLYPVFPNYRKLM